MRHGKEFNKLESRERRNPLISSNSKIWYTLKVFLYTLVYIWGFKHFDSNLSINFLAHPSNPTFIHLSIHRLFFHMCYLSFAMSCLISTKSLSVENMNIKSGLCFGT
jgi:hypothetical protein